MASETVNLYPSNLMFYLAKNAVFIKGLRTCALNNKTLDEMNRTLHEFGVKWVLFDVNENWSIVNSLKQKNIITFFKNINDTSKFFRDNLRFFFQNYGFSR